MTGKIRVLVAEDHYSIAMELRTILVAGGFDVVGPVGSVAAAQAAVAEWPDVALLDINLHGLPIFPVADRLMALGIPFAFTSGYDTDVLPIRYCSTPRLEKPVDREAVHGLVASLVSRESSV